MTYTIAIEPSSKAGQVTATSSDGHTFLTTTPLLEGAPYWLKLGAEPTATITSVWSSGSTHWSLRSTIATPPSWSWSTTISKRPTTVDFWAAHKLARGPRTTPTWYVAKLALPPSNSPHCS